MYQLGRKPRSSTRRLLWSQLYHRWGSRGWCCSFCNLIRCGIGGASWSRHSCWPIVRSQTSASWSSSMTLGRVENLQHLATSCHIVMNSQIVTRFLVGNMEIKLCFSLLDVWNANDIPNIRQNMRGADDFHTKSKAHWGPHQSSSGFVREYSTCEVACHALRFHAVTYLPFSFSPFQLDVCMSVKLDRVGIHLPFLANWFKGGRRRLNGCAGSCEKSSLHFDS